MTAPTGDRLPTPLLDRVHQPQDLHAMTNGELEALAEEVRAELVRVVFETGGHLASNLGTVELAIARDLQGEHYQVVAVIGDGGLTGGMALEALNHIGHIGKRLIVVLNDNGMSIAPNVGAINRVFNKVRLDARYQFAKSSLGQIARKMPMGDTAWEASRRVKRSVKGMLMPSSFFEELGFEYIGPVDGHNIAEMRAALQNAMLIENRPVFIHAITQKGHGYEPAENDPVKLHGVSPAGGGSGGPPKYQDVFGTAVGELMRQDRYITAITAAMPDGTGLVPVLKEFPDRAFDVGICEQHAVTLAAGMATQGIVPVVAIYSTFLQRAYDQDRKSV